MKWDGEWHITYEVFRDLGLAFAAVLVLIYVLVVGWFQSFTTPLVIMAPIPLSLVGILPAHALLGAFFTATSMIGFIAGAGIIVRNSIILVDFIELRRAQGMPLEEAVVDAGAVRFRPMLLTAAAVVVGACVILFDPIFQGLAISLMAGEVASTVLSRMAVPVLYYMSQRGETIHGGSRSTIDRWLRLIAARSSPSRSRLAIGQRVLLPVHGVRRAEFVPVGPDQLVPHDDDPAIAGGAGQCGSSSAKVRLLITNILRAKGCQWHVSTLLTFRVKRKRTPSHVVYDGPSRRLGSAGSQGNQVADSPCCREPGSSTFVTARSRSGRAISFSAMLTPAVAERRTQVGLHCFLAAALHLTPPDSSIFPIP